MRPRSSGERKECKPKSQITFWMQMGASKNKHYHGNRVLVDMTCSLFTEPTNLFQFLPDSTSSLPTILTQFNTWHKRIQLNVPYATFQFSLDILQVDRNSWVQVKVQEVHCWVKQTCGTNWRLDFTCPKSSILIQLWWTEKVSQRHFLQRAESLSTPVERR